MEFPSSFYNHLAIHNYTEIKGGTSRIKFLEIWVVCVGKRIFARSWDKSERSWFTAFENEGEGQLKYGAEVMDVYGKKVSVDDSIHDQINEAYINRFTSIENQKYAIGISQPEYANFTMEFFIKFKRNKL